ncbi:unnamed protein product [Closterium sp. NIES-65]|nr:unnamed protein product [Closterium sp. NIES-65]
MSLKTQRREERRNGTLQCTAGHNRTATGSSQLDLRRLKPAYKSLRSLLTPPITLLLLPSQEVPAVIGSHCCSSQQVAFSSAPTAPHFPAGASSLLCSSAVVSLLLPPLVSPLAIPSAPTAAATAGDTAGLLFCSPPHHFTAPAAAYGREVGARKVAVVVPSLHSASSSTGERGGTTRQQQVVTAQSFSSLPRNSAPPFTLLPLPSASSPSHLLHSLHSCFIPFTAHWQQKVAKGSSRSTTSQRSSSITPPSAAAPLHQFTAPAAAHVREVGARQHKAAKVAFSSAHGREAASFLPLLLLCSSAVAHGKAFSSAATAAATAGPTAGLFFCSPTHHFTAPAAARGREVGARKVAAAVPSLHSTSSITREGAPCLSNAASLFLCWFASPSAPTAAATSNVNAGLLASSPPRLLSSSPPLLLSSSPPLFLASSPPSPPMLLLQNGKEGKIL